MSWVAAAIGGGAIVGGLISADASGRASNAQVSSANQADATQRYMFDQSTALSAPWREAGAAQLPALTEGLKPGGQFSRMFTMDDFQADPGYAFRQSEGQKALERSAAARGGLLSGRTGKELVRYGQDYASNEFGNAYNRFNADRDRLYNRLAAVAGLGQTSSRDVSNNAMTLGTNLANTTMAAGNARASGYVGGANAITGAMGSGLSAWQSQQFINGLNTRRYTMDNYQQVQPSVPGQFNLDTYG